MCAKKATDEKILDTALLLFNRHHCSQVSLRNIAAEMDISDGNLRYHFQHKETIVLALFQRMSIIMNSLITMDNPPNLAALRQGIEQVFDIMVDYRFFFDEAVYLREAYPTYAILHAQLQQSRKALFIDLFGRLKKQQIFKNYGNDQYEMLFEQLFIIADNWITYIPSLASEMEMTEAKNHYVQVSFALFAPYTL